jgi:DNA-directed RNA polymerase specialized sigma24 family protein
VALVDVLTRFREGDAEALGRLHDLLTPAIRSIIGRYRWSSLPSAISAQDLQQQSWVILGELAGRWRPTGSFLAFFFASFPRELRRYVVRARLDRGGPVQVQCLAPTDLVELADRSHFGAVEPESLPWADQLAALPARERAAFVMRARDSLDFASIGSALGVSRASAHRFFRRACDRLGTAALAAGLAPSIRGRQPSLGDVPRRPGGETGCDAELSPVEVARLVRVLHRLATASGRLPGRRRLMAPTGLDRAGLSQLMSRLENAGVVVERGPGRSGRLAEPTLTGTLRLLGIFTPDHHHDDPARRTAP